MYKYEQQFSGPSDIWSDFPILKPLRGLRKQTSLVDEAIFDGSKINNLTAERLITLMPQGY
ncbi:MAG: hypothetical protein ACI3X9_03735, partial [Bacteroidaceae bacterium]